jgi:hypothetical protein
MSIEAMAAALAIQEARTTAAAFELVSGEGAGWRARFGLILDKRRVLTVEQSLELCRMLAGDERAPAAVRAAGAAGVKVHGQYPGSGIAVQTAEYWCLRAASLGGVGLGRRGVRARAGGEGIAGSGAASGGSGSGSDAGGVDVPSFGDAVRRIADAARGDD